MTITYPYYSYAHCPNTWCRTCYPSYSTTTVTYPSIQTLYVPKHRKPGPAR